MAVVAAGLGFVTPLAGPSYTTALVSGLVFPPLTASLAALLVDEGPSLEPRLLRGLRLGALHAVTVVGIAVLHGFRVGLCAPLHDLALMLLGPVSGMLAAGAWGVAAGVLSGPWGVRPPRWRAFAIRVGLGLLGPTTGILLSLGYFVSSPMVYAFDPFVGFFAGTPYDTAFDPTARLSTYRLGTAGWLLFAWALSRNLQPRGQGGAALRRPLDRPFVAAAVLGLCLGVSILASGVRLGHRSTAQSIRDALGHRVLEGRCEVVYGVPIDAETAKRLGRDCNGWLEVLERRLEAPRVPGVTAYVFANAQQKEWFMGAGRTQVAKPWRREIYLNGAGYPQGVLGHELAHVVAGGVAPGPFRVAGSWGGWWPNPGLIEGLAVALAPDDDEDLTNRQWAEALQRLGRLPPLARLFGLGFFVDSGPLSYTVAGAFVTWVVKAHGRRTVRDWYSEARLPKLTGLSWIALERGFQGDLQGVQLSDAELQLARERFARKGVYLRHCPQAVDRELDDADSLLGSGEPARACEAYRSARQLDPSELRARFGLGNCARLLGQTSPAAHAYRGIADDASLPDPVRQRARELMADMAYQQGDFDRARQQYASLARETVDADQRRMLEVKATKVSRTGARALETLFFGDGERPTWDVAAADLQAWADAEPNQGLSDYLLGRNFWQNGRTEAARIHLDRALSRSIEPPSADAEALRLRVVLACALGESELAQKLSKRYLARDSVSVSRRQGLAALVARCTADYADDPWPELPDATQDPAAKGLAGKKGVAAATAVASEAGESAWAPQHFQCQKGMMPIPGHTFWMGAAGHRFSPEESPRFQTRVASFCLDRTETTVAAYQQCMDAGACTAPSAHTKTCNLGRSDRSDHPVNCVTWDQAVAYCSFRHARLPTEIEWEYAARGGPEELTYPWGEGSPDGRACWKQPHSCKVESFPAGAFGLFDMSGNVWEWTASDFGPYPWPPAEHGLKVYLGGSWSRRFEKWMHLGLRNRWQPDKSGSHLGFRCAATPEGVTCPFGEGPDHGCLAGVLEVECDPGQSWNGQRCARPSWPTCPEGQRAVEGHGCVRDTPLVIAPQAPDVSEVRRRRSPKFDADCRKNQPKRPYAYRYVGGGHVARNRVGSSQGCKNRDVGVGWNSACCPH